MYHPEYTANDWLRDDAGRDAYDAAETERERAYEEDDLRAQEREIDLITQDAGGNR